MPSINNPYAAKNIGWTPIHFAVADGWTSIHFAVANGHLEIV